VLAGNCALAEVIQRSATGIEVVGAGQSHMIELLDTLRMTEVMNTMRDQFDLVLVDTAPLAIAAESMAVANRIDGSMIVVRAMRDQRGLIGRLIGQLTSQRGRFVGAVLNRPEQTAGGYYRKNAELASKYSAEVNAGSAAATPAGGAT
jgi:Mrp family chromosome partitioning ATPase